ncbi:MAG: 30S ribosomal protein S17 [Candidatus Zixiibacteriota bacterium]
MADEVRKDVRKVRVGTVIQDKMEKSIVVRVDRTMRHPLYEKIFRTYSKLYAHDENNEARVGDVVRVAETRPLSKKKRWRLVEILERAK